MTDEVRRAVRRLATFVSEAPAPDDAVAERAAAIFADTVGVGIRGSIMPTSAALRAGLPRGAAELFAPTATTATVEEASFCNAVALCSMELDEGIRPTGHPAMHVLPALLASAQETGASGATFLRAFVLGYEVQARLQRAAALRPPVHCHGTYGHVGAAAALAALRGWDADRTTAVLHAAASSVSATSYSLPYAGATIHWATPSLSAAAALRSIRLIDAGFTAWDGSIGEVFGRVLGDGVDPGPLDESLGEEWAVMHSYVKFHGTCGHAHAPLEAAIDALGAGGAPGTLGAAIDIDTIAAIDVELPERACELSATEATTALGARFSVPLSIAALLRHGDTSADAFDARALGDPALSVLARKVRLHPTAQFDRDFLHHHRARVRIRFHDGTVRSGDCDNPYGNAMRPADLADVKEKYLRNVAEAAPTATAGAWSTVIEVAKRPSMAGLLADIRCDAGANGSP